MFKSSNIKINTPNQYSNNNNKSPYKPKLLQSLIDSS